MYKEFDGVRYYSSEEAQEEVEKVLDAKFWFLVAVFVIGLFVAAHFNIAITG